MVAFFGPIVTIAAFALGELSVVFLVAFLLVAFLLGIVLSIAALTLEEFSFRRHQSARDIVRLLVYAIIENVGYRQLNDFWRALALVDLLRRKQGWGAQRRLGIGSRAATVLPSEPERRDR